MTSCMELNGKNLGYHMFPVHEKNNKQRFFQIIFVTDTVQNI